jgi:two-component system sensor histidine kinase HydH
MVKSYLIPIVSNRKTMGKILALGIMIGATLFLHYFTYHELKYHHAVYRMLFYFPLVLGGFWFGLRGAMAVSACVTVFYLPFVMKDWQGFSFENFSKLLEGALFVTVAMILGFLVERRKREYLARVDAEHLAAVGRTVSEIAHDMKAPLMAIGGFAAQLDRKMGQEDPASHKKLIVIVKETARLEAMLKDMLDFARPLELRLTPTDLNRVVSESLGIAESFAEEAGVDLRAELAASLPLLTLDTPRMQQAILNLVTNAVQACHDGGQVTIRTHHSSRFVSMDVTDCGHGIKEEDRDRIFQPFFSTKRDGTGLGLANVKKIVEAHGGRISLQSNPEKGVTFTIRFAA